MSKSKKKKIAAKLKKSEKKKNRSIKSHTLQLDNDLSCRTKPDITDDVKDVETHFYPYDENLLERARTQWQFGDWQSLAEIDRDSIQHHPDRAKLALLAAAGHMQLGDLSVARQFTILATDWGCNNKHISQILIAGVHNSLGRSASIMGQKVLALKHFEASVAIGSPGSDTRLLGQARANMQISQSEMFLKIDLNCIPRIADPIEGNMRSETAINCIELHPVVNYCIDPSYECRKEYVHYDDMEVQDKWQLEVYLHVYALMKKNNFSTVVDIGCGSAFKLLTYLGDFNTIGYELPENVELLKRQYPERDWRFSDFESDEKNDVDIVICADVIEHLVDPDILIRYLLRQKFKLLVLSTPDKDLVYTNEADRFGPPRNVSHIREWSFNEFAAYIGRYFHIIVHRITNIEQSTQMIVCKNKYE